MVQAGVDSALLLDQGTKMGRAAAHLQNPVARLDPRNHVTVKRLLFRRVLGGRLVSDLVVTGRRFLIECRHGVAQGIQLGGGKFSLAADQ